MSRYSLSYCLALRLQPKKWKRNSFWAECKQCYKNTHESVSIVRELCVPRALFGLFIKNGFRVESGANVSYMCVLYTCLRIFFAFIHSHFLFFSQRAAYWVFLLCLLLFFYDIVCGIWHILLLIVRRLNVCVNNAY